jgi:hypothetical protein
MYLWLKILNRLENRIKIEGAVLDQISICFGEGMRISGT